MKRLIEADLEHVLTNTKDAWEQARNKSFFLTGGTGFFGKWLSESFLYINKALGLNARLVILSRNPHTFLETFPFYKEEKSVEFVKGDILNFEFPSTHFDYVLHAATDADAALNASNPLLMLDTITLGTRRILEFARNNNVESFLFTSSGAVYGKQPAHTTHVTENDFFNVDINNPHSAYAEGKRLAELYCSIYNSHFNLPVKIARCFAFIGPYLPLDKHFAAGNFINNALNGEDITIKGDGSPFRSYLYAADLAVWLWRILLQGKDNFPYNVGSDEDYDLETVANTIAQSRDVRVKILTKRDSSKPVERYVPAVDRIRDGLKVDVSFTLKEAIKRTIDFYERSQAV